MPSPRIPLPSDDQLPQEAQDLLANLPALNVFRMLANLPASLRPFLELGGALLADDRLDPRTREIAILRVAHTTGAGYEWVQHAQLARNVGVSDAEIEALATADPGDALDEDAALACRVAEEISRDVRLSDAALAQLLERYGPQGAASLILCVSYYNMVSRFLESTRVEIEAGVLLGDQTPDSVIERGREATQ
jgi:4-carboxymuconolactone decarboxylase